MRRVNRRWPNPPATPKPTVCRSGMICRKRHQSDAGWNRLRVQAYVDAKGAKRLLNMALLDDDEDDSTVDDEYADRVVTAFKTLLAGLSPEQQEPVRTQVFPNNSTSRAGKVLGTILRLVPRFKAVALTLNTPNRCKLSGISIRIGTLPSPVIGAHLFECPRCLPSQ
jgi:hypothetical protein